MTFKKYKELTILYLHDHTPTDYEFSDSEVVILKAVYDMNYEIFRAVNVIKALR